MAMTMNIGRVGLKLRGAWDAGTEYAVLDVVRHLGGLWGAMVASTGTRPGEGSAWALMMQGREVCTKDLTLYVRAGGNDAHDGRTVQTAFATPQAAIRATCGIDAQGHNVTIDIGPGVFAGDVEIGGKGGGPFACNTMTITGEGMNSTQIGLVTANANGTKETIVQNVRHGGINNCTHPRLLVNDTLSNLASGTHIFSRYRGSYTGFGGRNVFGGTAGTFCEARGGRINFEDSIIEFLAGTTVGTYGFRSTSGGIMDFANCSWVGSFTGPRVLCGGGSIMTGNGANADLMAIPGTSFGVINRGEPGGAYIAGQGIAQAQVNISGVNGANTYATSQIVSTERTGTGVYTITLSTPTPSTAVVVPSLTGAATAASAVGTRTSATVFTVRTFNASGSALDYSTTCFFYW